MSKPLRSARYLVALAGLIVGAAFAQNTAAPYSNAARVTNLTYGIVCYAAEATPIPAPDTITGFINERPGGSTFIVETLAVPIIRGLSFGVRVEVLGGRALDDVLLTVIHPPQTGAAVTTESWTARFDAGGANGGSFTFEFPYEETPGQWIMEARHGGDLLYRVVFDVRDPSSFRQLPRLCEGEELLG